MWHSVVLGPPVNQIIFMDIREIYVKLFTNIITLFTNYSQFSEKIQNIHNLWWDPPHLIPSLPQPGQRLRLPRLWRPPQPGRQWRWVLAAAGRLPAPTRQWHYYRPRGRAYSSNSRSPAPAPKPIVVKDMWTCSRCYPPWLPRWPWRWCGSDEGDGLTVDPATTNSVDGGDEINRLTYSNTVFLSRVGGTFNRNCHDILISIMIFRNICTWLYSK